MLLSPAAEVDSLLQKPPELMGQLNGLWYVASALLVHRIAVSFSMHTFRGSFLLWRAPQEKIEAVALRAND